MGETTDIKQTKHFMRVMKGLTYDERAEVLAWMKSGLLGNNDTKLERSSI